MTLFGWYKYTQFLNVWILENSEILVISGKSLPLGAAELEMMNVKIDRVCWLTQYTFIPFCTQQNPDWSLKMCEVKAMTVCLPFLTEKAIGMMKV